MAISDWLFVVCSCFGSTVFWVQIVNLRRRALAKGLPNFYLRRMSNGLKHAAHGLDACKRRRGIRVTGDQSQDPNPSALILGEFVSLGAEDRTMGAGHFPNIPRRAVRARDVSAGSLLSDASRSSSSQASSFLFTIVPNISSITVLVV